MICPNCKAEYRDGFFTCSDCKVPLVSALKEEESAPTSGNWVEIASTQDFTHLALVKMMFEREGIRYAVWGDVMMGAGIARGGGPAHLFVLEGEEERAKELLDSLTS